MGWIWRFEDASGAEIAPAGVSNPGAFPAQGDAESWVGETWQELLPAGIDAVSLLDGDRLVYGPMSLHAAD